MFCVPILRSCGVLLCSKHPFRQCVVPVKCMSLVMYCVIIIEYSVFNDLELVFGFGITQKASESRSLQRRIQRGEKEARVQVKFSGQRMQIS